MSVVAAPHHLRRHVLDGAAEGVGPTLGLVRRELAAQTLNEGNSQSKVTWLINVWNHDNC